MHGLLKILCISCDHTGRNDSLETVLEACGYVLEMDVAF
jgi:hypothetical protein